METREISNTPYDDVFRTMLNSCPDMIIPVVNEALGTGYVKGKDKVILSNNELFLAASGGKQAETITDTQFSINGTSYHIECQSTSDGTMVVRMFEYDVQIAMKNGEKLPGRYRIVFPHSAVLLLRGTKNSPDSETIEIVVPGDSCSYSVPYLKISNYSADDIFEKDMLFLIPFHIFSYESGIKRGDKEMTADRLGSIYAGIREKLEQLCGRGGITEYDKQVMLEMSVKVVNHLLADYGDAKERVGDVMGGRILETEAGKIFKQGCNDIICRSVQKGKMTLESGAEMLGITVDELKRCMKVGGYQIPQQ